MGTLPLPEQPEIPRTKEPRTKTARERWACFIFIIWFLFFGFPWFLSLRFFGFPYVSFVTPGVATSSTPGGNSTGPIAYDFGVRSSFELIASSQVIRWPV